MTGNSSGGATGGVGANAVSDGIVEGFGGGGNGGGVVVVSITIVVRGDGDTCDGGVVNDGSTTVVVDSTTVVVGSTIVVVGSTNIVGG